MVGKLILLSSNLKGSKALKKIALALLPPPYRAIIFLGQSRMVAL